MKPSTLYPTAKSLLLSILGIILILFGAIWLFTRNAFLSSFVLSDRPSDIGAAIGGITAPITSLLGSFLIYLSFRAQFSANRLLKEQWEYDTLRERFNDIQNNLASIKYTYTIATGGFRIEGNVGWDEGERRITFITYEGTEALCKFADNIEVEAPKKTIGTINDVSFVIEELRVKDLN